MKATGIVRRIDDLGRVVVPKEIRRTLRIREGDPLEIFTNHEGGIILKKYSPIGELGELAAEYVEAVAQVAKCTVCVTDRDIIVAVAGPQKRELHGRNIHCHLIECMEQRASFAADSKDAVFCQIVEGEENPFTSEAIATIVSEGNVIGTVVLLTNEDSRKFGDLEEKMAICGANFLGKQMEQ